MPFTYGPDLTMHYETAGAGEGVLVLVHGNFASWRWWRPVLDRLPGGYCAYAPDLRGCGDTDRPPDGYSIPQLAADLHAFVSALGVSGFHLVGHSLGGAVALQYALDHPGQLQTLTLVAPAPAEGMPLFRPAGPASPLSLFDLRDASLAALDSVYRLWDTLDANRPILRRALMRMAPTLDDDDAFERLVDDAAHMAPQAVVGHLRALDEWDVQAELGRLNVPALIVGGGRDALIPPAAWERMVGGLPRGQLMVWPDTGHAPQLEQPERFTQALFGFIRDHTSARAPQGWLRMLWDGLRGRGAASKAA
jgi:pimeloyl-ACP methyl ester carboxylesterase